MKKSLFYAIVGLVVLSSCSKETELYQTETPSKTSEELLAHAESVLGITIAPNQDWCTTSNSKVTISIENNLLTDVEKVQILTVSPFGNKDANGSLALTEAAISYGKSVTLSYDAPKMYSKLYAACVTKDGKYFVKSFNVGDQNVVFTSNERRAAQTRSGAGDFNLEDMVKNLDDPVIGSVYESFAHQRCARKQSGWVDSGWENDMLYAPVDVNATKMEVVDYSEDYKSDLYDMIFRQYLRNKEKNLDKIRQSDYFVQNNNYPLVTKGRPVIMAPVYKNDSIYREIEDCELYYYYFKQDQIAGMSEAEEIQFMKDLPKYKAVNLHDIVYDPDPLVNDVIFRKNAFALVYWGDGTPDVNTKGSYTFPADYKLGFMIRRVDKDQNKNKNGEMYCDGRLNKEINKWGNFKTAGFAPDDPRMAWFWANDRDYLCCETGSDQDVNDVVFEVLGGIVVPPPPTVDTNKYTFCFEDTPGGDYDLNDVVIRGWRKDATHVVWQLVACGAYDEVYIKNINGTVINENTEVHKMMGKSTTKVFINTQGVNPETPIVEEEVEVSENFSFLNSADQPYIFDKTNGVTVKVALMGQDPHAIMVPYNFRYPLEKIRVNTAYTKFNNWASGAYVTDGETGNEWYLKFEEKKVSALVSK